MHKNYLPLNKHFINNPIAHRGLHNEEVSENSLQAFSLAKEKGYAIEIDVHLLKDGNVAIVHDSNLQRVTGYDVIIENLTKDELDKYPLFNKEKIPLLNELLSLINGEVPILIEIKANKLNKPLCNKLLEILSTYPYKDKIALQSFEPMTVRYLKKKTNDYSVGYLCTNKLSDVKCKLIESLLVKMKLLSWMRADFISYDIHFLPNKYVKAKQEKGYQLLVWTINSEDKLQKAREIGDNIIFEKIKLN